MKPRKHLHVKYCWQTYLKSIGTLSQTFKNHIHNNIVTVACKWCVPSASDVFLSKNDNSRGENLWGFQGGGIWYLFHGIWFLSCVFTCSDCYPLSNQINLLMVIDIWGIIIQIVFYVYAAWNFSYRKHSIVSRPKAELWLICPAQLKNLFFERLYTTA